MAITLPTLIVGVMIIFGLPAAVYLLNRWRRHAGWWLLLGFIAFIIVGNLVEKLIWGSSPLF